MKLLKNRCTNFVQCIEYAVRKFYKYFRNDIRQLLFAYPLDKKMADGEPFWKLPKRPPRECEGFDSANPLHRDFVVSLAVQRAKIFGIECPANFRESAVKDSIAKEAQNIKVFKSLIKYRRIGCLIRALNGGR